MDFGLPISPFQIIDYLEAILALSVLSNISASSGN